MQIYGREEEKGREGEGGGGDICNYWTLFMYVLDMSLYYFTSTVAPLCAADLMSLID